jgi:hypothetical protein
MAQMIRKSPRSKAELLDRLTMSTFTGSLRDLGERVNVERIKPNMIALHFGDTGRTMLLTVHMPRPESAKKPAGTQAGAEVAKAKNKRAAKGRGATRH